MNVRCGYRRPTVIPVCRRMKTSWSINRSVSTPDDVDDDIADDVMVPWTMRMLRSGQPCPNPIEAPHE